MPEVECLAAFFDEEAKPDFFHERCDHLCGHLFRQHLVRTAREREFYFYGELGQIRWSGPKSRRLHLWVDMNFAVNQLAVLSMSRGGLLSPIRGQRLTVGAVGHIER